MGHKIGPRAHLLPTRAKSPGTAEDSANYLILLEEIGAGERIRTVDPNLGKVSSGVFRCLLGIYKPP
jgi:hypothetical protein